MSAAKLPFTIKNVIVCEDIREELRGKHSLIGVYSGDEIQISQIPGNIAISCFIEVKVNISGAYDMNLRLRGPGKHSALLKARLNFHEVGKLAVIPTPRLDIRVDREGIFKIDIGSTELGWTNIVKREIVLNPSIAALDKHKGN